MTLIWKNDSEIIQKLNSTPAALCFNLEKFNFHGNLRRRKSEKILNVNFHHGLQKASYNENVLIYMFLFFFQSEVAISYLQWWLNKAALALKSVDLTANVAFGKHTLNR